MAVQLSIEPTSTIDVSEVHSTTADTHLEMTESILKDIDIRTNGSIRDLKVSFHEGLLTVAGRTSRYYYKQLATSAVFGFSDDLELQNSIAVY